MDIIISFMAVACFAIMSFIFLSNSNEKQKYHKKNIPLALKRSVWERDIGLDVGRTKCPICKSTDILQSSFHACHVIPESKGGQTNLNNLKVGCGGCNLSMGRNNYDTFKSKFD